MTIASTTNKVSYNGSGSTGPFSITFKFAKNADIVATKVSTAGVETTLTLTTHYTLTGAGDDSGGTLTLVTALATGEKLIIKRSPSIVQETDYVENADFPAESHEAALDLLTMICQDLDERLDRAVTIPISSSVTPTDYLTTVEGYKDSAAASAATATTQAGLATTNGAAQVVLAAAQVSLATTQAGLASTSAGNAATAQGLAEDARDAAVAAVGKLKVSSDDTTAGYLDGKLALAANSGLVLAVTSPAGNEVLTIAADTGTTANKIVKLDGSAKLPAVDGSALTNLPGGGGYKTIFVGGGAMTPSQTAGATPAIIEDGTNDLTRPCMMFKGVTADTSAEWCHAMPEDWDRSTVKAKVMWSAQAGASASDTVRFSLSAGAFSDDDALDAALGTAVTMDDTVTAAGDMQTTPASAALTVGGTPALGDLIRWKITRDFDYGGQPMTEDAAVIGVWIQYQATNTPAAW